MVAMATLVDRYGFALVGLSAEEAKTRGASAARETTMANKWVKMDVTTYDPAAKSTAGTAQPSKALKALVRGGIPSALRPAVWLHFSGGAAKKAAASAGFYSNLQRRSAAGTVDAAELAAELSRAFGTHPLLSSIKGMRSVLRILEGYHLLRPTKLGLGRGMACIAAFMLVVMGPEREEDAFWTFMGLVEDKVPRSCVVENMKGPGVEQRVLRALLAKRCPKVLAQLERAETPLEDVTASWFHTLFCTALPAETVVRIWDVLLLEGPKILFRVALALFKLNESALLSAKMSAHVSRTVKWRIARCYDADALFKVAFSGIGSLPMSLIKRARADYEGIVQEELAEHRRRLQAVLSPSKDAAGSDVSPSSSEQGSPVHLSTIYEEETDAAFAMYENGADSEEPKGFSTSSFLGGFLQPLRAVTG